MPTLFTKIVNGQIPCHKILEDEKYLAFLDIRPINPGHTLCIPKQEIDYIFDMPDNLLSGLMIFSKKIAKALKRTIDCKRIGVMVVGIEVPHTHIHLVPFSSIPELTFARAKPADSHSLRETAEKIVANL